MLDHRGCRFPRPPVRPDFFSKHRKQANPAPSAAPAASAALACHSKSASPAFPTTSASPLPPPPPPAPASASSEAGAFGCKGYGKGNYGTEIPGPSPISAPPQDLTTGGRYVGPKAMPCFREAEPIPEPVKVTEELVAEWLLTFRPFTPPTHTRCRPRWDNMCFGEASRKGKRPAEHSG